MQLALRSPLSAGIALVGATAIALSPIAPPAPDLTIKAEHISSVYADYTPTGLATALTELVNGVGTAGNQAIQGIGGIGNTVIATVGGLGNALSATGSARWRRSPRIR